MELNNPLAKIISTKLEAKKTQNKQDPTGSNAILYAILELIQAVDTSTQSTMVHAKVIEANGVAQQRLDNEMEQLKYDDVKTKYLPSTYYTKYHYHFTQRSFWGHKYHFTGTRYVKHHGYYIKTTPGAMKHWTVRTTYGGKIHMHGRTRSHHYRVKITANKASLALAQEKNMKADAERQQLAAKLQVDQQGSKVQMTRLNTEINGTAQTTQKTSALLNMLKQLTDKILLPKNSQSFA